MSTLTNISNRFKYWTALVLAEESPQADVRAELMKQGWQFQSTLSREDVINNAMVNGMAGPMGCVTFGRTKISNAEGEDIFQTGNKELQKRYKDDLRAAAARLYGIKP